MYVAILSLILNATLNYLLAFVFNFLKEDGGGGNGILQTMFRAKTIEKSGDSPNQKKIELDFDFGMPDPHPLDST